MYQQPSLGCVHCIPGCQQCPVRGTHVSGTYPRHSQPCVAWERYGLRDIATLAYIYIIVNEPRVENVPQPSYLCIPGICKYWSWKVHCYASYHCVPLQQSVTQVVHTKFTTSNRPTKQYTFVAMQPQPGLARPLHCPCVVVGVRGWDL